MFQKPQELVKILLDKGYTEQWIGQKARISQSTVNRYKYGMIDNPRWELVERLEKLVTKYTQDSIES